MADALCSAPQRPGRGPGHAAAGLPLLGRPGPLHGRPEAGDPGGRRRAALPAAAGAGASLTAAMASHWWITAEADQSEFLSGTSLAAERRAESPEYIMVQNVKKNLHYIQKLTLRYIVI